MQTLTLPVDRRKDTCSWEENWPHFHLGSRYFVLWCWMQQVVDRDFSLSFPLKFKFWKQSRTCFPLKRILTSFTSFQKTLRLMFPISATCLFLNVFKYFKGVLIGLNVDFLGGCYPPTFCPHFSILPFPSVLFIVFIRINSDYNSFTISRPVSPVLLSFRMHFFHCLFHSLFYSFIPESLKPTVICKEGYQNDWPERHKAPLLLCVSHIVDICLFLLIDFEFFETRTKSHLPLCSPR